MKKILVSACLMGERVRFDGQVKAVPHPILLKWNHEKRVVPVCPEVDGGLEIPRPPAEIQGGCGRDLLTRKVKIKNNQGRDVTDFFIRGAEIALEQAMRVNVVMAVLKEKSPSCGSTFIYDGSFTRRLIPGQGVTAALLTAHGIKIFSEKELDLALSFLLNPSSKPI